MTATAELVRELASQDQDHEWYPTTDRMIAAVKRYLPERCKSIMDIGAGDGRVLAALAEKCEGATLYGIELAAALVQAQPDSIVPVGTNFYEQNLACLPVDYIFSNPPFTAFGEWAEKIIAEGHAKKAYLVLPRRWKESASIARALERRGATARAIHSDDFHDAERRARAVVDVVEVRYPCEGYYDEPVDPFDIWFDQNIDTFDQAPEPEHEYETAQALARQHSHSTIGEMVAAYREEYERMERNYKAIFKLDHALLRELGVSKENVREGIKKKMAGLKSTYWQLLFNRLDAITTRLSTKTRERFLAKLTGNTAVEFSGPNAYAVVLWAIKNANRYFDEQLIQLFRDLATFEGVKNYKSNCKTWEKNGWRYNIRDHSHFALDYRIVVSQYSAIPQGDCHWNYPAGLAQGCHELLADIVAVLSNLGFLTLSPKSLDREWVGGQWEDWHTHAGDVLFQVKAYKNGNLHFRFRPEAIRALNIEAGRLLGWIQTKEDATRELGYTPDEVAACWGANAHLLPSNVKLLTA